MTQTILLVIYFALIYNYTVSLGEENDTIIMYYDEPISEEQWEEMEKADEKEHAEEAKEWYEEEEKEDD